MAIPHCHWSERGIRIVSSACALVLLLVILPSITRADCSAVSSKIPSQFSDAALANLNKFLDRICDAANGDIYAANHPELKGRLEEPSGGVLNKDDIYPEKAKRKGLEGTVVLALVVETDGSIRNAVAIESSGYELLDEAAISWNKKNRFDNPARLDGKAVRTPILLPDRIQVGTLICSGNGKVALGIIIDVLVIDAQTATSTPEPDSGHSRARVT